MNINKINELKIDIYYHFDYNDHFNIHIKKILEELYIINNIFTDDIIQECVKYNDNTINKFIKLLCLKFMNEYEFIIIVFEILKILNNNSIKNIKLYKYLSEYIKKLSKKSKIVDLLNNKYLIMDEYKELISYFSKLFYNYFDFEVFYEKLTTIHDNNKILFTNKDELKNHYEYFKHYSNIFEKINREKFKINEDINIRFFYILKKIKKIE